MSQLNDVSLSTAKENMAMDDHLLQSCIDADNSHFLRFYIWKNKGLTQARKRAVPEDLSAIDQSERATGGGLVFHCPGDVVFSIGIKRHKSGYSIKHYLQIISEHIRAVLLEFSISAELSSERQSSEKFDIQFCASYYSPFEVYVNGSKVLGVAAKRTQDYFFFQGVLHLQASATHFGDYTQTYSDYFSNGCNIDNEMSHVIKDHLLHSFQNALSV